MSRSRRLMVVFVFIYTRVYIQSEYVRSFIYLW